MKERTRQRMEATTDDWIERLTQEGPEQTTAIAELGELLKRRLERAFRGEPRVDDSLIDDVIQDSLTVILQSVHQFAGKSQFTTWATTISVRMVLREMRRLRWKDTSLDKMMGDQSAAIEPSVSHDDPAAKASSAQMIEIMYRIINEDLGEKQRAVLLSHLNGMPQAEIGRRLGCNRNAVYKLGFDARTKLREGMIAAGYAAEDLQAFEATR